LTATARTARDGLDSFTEAEAALAQVMADNHDARAVREEMAPTAERLIERMSDAGFGEPMHVRASDVLARLKAVAGRTRGANQGAVAATLIESSSPSQ
jgi:hypothetical protein